MVITIEGYNQKKNNSPFVAAALSSMLSMAAGRKVLAINLIDQDMWNIERIVMGLGTNDDIGFSDEGIDQLLREADTRKLMKGQFDTYTKPVLKLENRFDIATTTKNQLFTITLEDKKVALQRVIENAQDVYDDIVILLPSNHDDICDLVKEMSTETLDKDRNKTVIKPLVDTSIVCIRQGFNKKYDAKGNNVIYLITDFEDESMYSFNMVSKEYLSQGLFRQSKAKCMKLARSVQANDAALSGTLGKWVKLNRELNKDDINYCWTEDMLNLVARVTGEKLQSISYDWESAEYLERPTQSFNPDKKKDDAWKDSWDDIEVTEVNLDVVGE